MRIAETSVYLGPSLYARFPVIRLVVDLGPLEEWPTGRLGDDFVNALLESIPTLREHGCSYGEPGGFVRRMTEDDGTWLGHVFEHVAIELQNVAGASVTFGKTRSTGEPNRYSVIYQYEEEEVGVEAGKLALMLLHSLLPDELRPGGSVPEGFDFTERLDGFIRFAQRRSLGPSTSSLVQAAKERGIPALRLNEYSLVQFGHGRYQKRIQATVTSETRHIAVEIASDKEETNRILGDLGLPVPRQRLVYTSEDAVAAAERIGFPVVVKPLNANHGKGVSINLSTPDEVALAFDHARKRGRTILVERFIEGFDHRLLVINGELIAASKRVPGHVVGNGKSTVEELVDETNLDPRRGIGHEKVLTRLEFDHQAERLLSQMGYDRNTVPPEGEVVYLRSTGNLSTGGTATDVTDLVHPDNREMATRAVAAIGLDVGGVDFLTTDISQSFKATGGAICEVNAAPGFRMHTAPSEGTPRDAAGPVMDMLFPTGTPTRIPVAAITGTNGKTTTARMTAHIFKLAGYHVGLTTTDGVYIDGHLTVEGDMTGPASARMVLRDPSVDAAVLE
ncbi:MAG: acetate--CoA ligase family protein, partial [Planctomycetota bacterium]